MALPLRAAADFPRFLEDQLCLSPRAARLAYSVDAEGTVYYSVIAPYIHCAPEHFNPGAALSEHFLTDRKRAAITMQKNPDRTVELYESAVSLVPATFFDANDRKHAPQPQKMLAIASSTSKVPLADLANDLARSYLLTADAYAPVRQGRLYKPGLGSGVRIVGARQYEADLLTRVQLQHVLRDTPAMSYDRIGLYCEQLNRSVRR